MTILHKSKDIKKLSFKHHENDDFKLKPYFSNLNASEARLRFKINSCMTPTIRMNFPSDLEYAYAMWACQGCQSEENVWGCRDTQQHVLRCPGYEGFRQSKDLAINKDIVEYIRLVIKHRQDNE